MVIKKIQCIIGVSATKLVQRIGILAFVVELLAITVGTYRTATMKMSRTYGLIRCIAISTLILSDAINRGTEVPCEREV